MTLAKYSFVIYFPFFLIMKIITRGVFLRTSVTGDLELPVIFGGWEHISKLVLTKPLMSV